MGARGLDPLSGTYLRTFAQPPLEHGCELYFFGKLKENGRERARINEPLRGPRLSSDVNRVLMIENQKMGARGLGLTNLCAALA